MGYDYERTRVSGSALFMGIGVVNEQRKNRAEELLRSLNNRAC
jgi:hypothetical protein